MDLLSSSFVNFFLNFGIEKNIFKLFNRHSFLIKKKFTEHKLYDFFDNKTYFSKLLLDKEKILNEEFLSKGKLIRVCEVEWWTAWIESSIVFFYFQKRKAVGWAVERVFKQVRDNSKDCDLGWYYKWEDGGQLGQKQLVSTATCWTAEAVWATRCLAGQPRQLGMFCQVLCKIMSSVRSHLSLFSFPSHSLWSENDKET